MYYSQIQTHTVLSRFQENVFAHPYVSRGKNADGLFAYARKMRKTEALAYPYINANGPRARKYLPLDIDQAVDLDDFFHIKIPQPNIVIRDRQTGKAHILYELEKPVYTKTASDTRPGEALPVRYYNSVREGLARVLQADVAFHGSLVKNPLNSKRWEVTVLTDHLYTLGELAEYCDLATVRCRKATALTPLEEAYEGCRQHTLFEHLRRWAYQEMQHDRSEESFTRAVEEKAECMNSQFPCPMTDGAVYSTAKTVAKWTWKNYTGHKPDNRRRGIMGLDSKLPIHVRQHMGQEFSAGVKVDKTEILLRDTIVKFHGRGLKLTKANIAEHARVNRRTVYRHWQATVALLPEAIKTLVNSVKKRPLPSSITSKLNSTVMPDPYTTESHTFKCDLSVEGLSKRDNEIFREAVPHVARRTGYGAAPLTDLIIAMQIRRKKKMRAVTIEKIKASKFYRDGMVSLTQDGPDRFTRIPRRQRENFPITDESIFTSRPLADDEVLVHGVFVVKRPKPKPETTVTVNKAKVAEVMARLKARECRAVA
jgi:Replicase family/Primase C terminal 1 (PriCT-1)